MYLDIYSSIDIEIDNLLNWIDIKVFGWVYNVHVIVSNLNPVIDKVVVVPPDIGFIRIYEIDIHNQIVIRIV